MTENLRSQEAEPRIWRCKLFNLGAFAAPWSPWAIPAFVFSLLIDLSAVALYCYQGNCLPNSLFWKCSVATKKKRLFGNSKCFSLFLRYELSLFSSATPFPLHKNYITIEYQQRKVEEPFLLLLSTAVVKNGPETCLNLRHWRMQYFFLLIRRSLQRCVQVN